MFLIFVFVINIELNFIIAIFNHLFIFYEIYLDYIFINWNIYFVDAISIIYLCILNSKIQRLVLESDIKVY